MTADERGEEILDALIDAQGAWVDVVGCLSGSSSQLRALSFFQGAPVVQVRWYGSTNHCTLNVSDLYLFKLKEGTEELTVRVVFLRESDSEGPILSTRLTCRQSNYKELVKEEVTRLANKYPGFRITPHVEDAELSGRASIMWGGSLES